MKKRSANPVFVELTVGEAAHRHEMVMEIVEEENRHTKKVPRTRCIYTLCRISQVEGPDLLEGLDIHTKDNIEKQQVSDHKWQCQIQKTSRK